MENARRIAAALVLALASVPAGAGTLYKSIGPDGVIQFTDMPPDAKSVVLERRAAAPSNPMNVAQSFDADDSVARANAEVDLAEHALALARRAMWSELEGVRLAPRRTTASDVQRVEFYKRGVLLARQNLMEALRARSTPAVLVASR